MSDTQLLAELTTFATASIRMATPLALAGLGETWSEKSGILNIGLEAIMLAGAFCGFMVSSATGNPWAGVLAGAAGGIAAALAHAFLAVTCRADQTIAGLALNFLVSGATSYFFLVAFGRSTRLAECPVLPAVPVPLLSEIPFFGPAFFAHNGFVYCMFLAVLLSRIILSRTEWGTMIHAAGENPRAADAAGLSVARIRYTAAAVNGLFGGLAGASLTLATLGFFMENVTSGKGYIALVVVILGRRNPVGVLFASMLLGAAEAFQFRVQTMGSGLPSQVFIMVPYLATVLVLLFSAGRSRDPAALGRPFDRSLR